MSRDRSNSPLVSCTAMTPELVLFDLDGVVVDSEPLSIRSLIDALVPLGLCLTPDQARQQWLGMSWPDLFGTIERRLGHRLPEGFSDRVIAAERARFETELRAVPGAEGLLESLAAFGVRRCIASSETLEGIELKLRVTGLRGHFDGGLYSAEMVEKGKPAPDLVQLAARSEGVAPAACVVLEDAPFGVMGAVAAGMRAIGYAGDAHAHPEALASAGAEVVRSLADIPALLGLPG